jgi:hypothetical protein
VPITKEPETSPVDVPWYVSDHGQVSKSLQWRPSRSPKQIVVDIAGWIRNNAGSLEPILV